MNNITNQPLVSICCITYNHAEYIQKTLDGFLMQNAKFSYEIIIHDDASTDNTLEIINNNLPHFKMPVKIIQEEENQFQKGVNIAFDILLNYVKGKYIAVCEGDDWWIDPNKLKTQIDFMEKNPECVMTLHNGIKIDVRTNNEKIINPFAKEGYISEYENYFAFMKNPPTASFVFRKDVLNDYPDCIRNAPVFDDVMRLFCFDCGKIYYFDRIMCERTYMHKDSWNKMLLENPEVFETYIFKLLEFYSQYNTYTNFLHDKLINEVKRKIGNHYLHLRKAIVDNNKALKIIALAGIAMEE